MTHSTGTVWKEWLILTTQEHRLIKLPNEIAQIVEVKSVQQIPLPDRAPTLPGKIYKIKSPKVSNSIYITIGYVQTNGKPKPYEIFINSKDLSKAAEYTVLTRLLSAIFRVVDDPHFVIEELRGIYDPNGGYFKDSKYMHSFYSEIADLIEQALHTDEYNKQEEVKEIKVIEEALTNKDDNMQICPKCGNKTAKSENGCLTCIEPSCAYSKCSG